MSAPASKSKVVKSQAVESKAKKPAAKKVAKTAAKKPKGKGATAYTKPELRERLKEEIKAGTKGGKAGQWSARKAQLLTAEYEKAGGGYTGKKTAAQKHLKEWTDEKWATSDGKPAARKGGTTRYLPKKAWDALSADEKKATNAKKVKGSKAGKQFVSNTAKAKTARKKAGG